MANTVIHDELILKISGPADDEATREQYHKIVEQFFRFAKNKLGAELDYLHGQAHVTINPNQQSTTHE